MTCKNCKYFNHELEANDFGRCTHPKMLDDANSLEAGDKCPADGVYATCDEYRGDLFVGINFGCIHFEEKI